MINSLTEHQIQMVKLYREKWLNKVFNYEIFHRTTDENVRKAMEELYEFCGLNKPQVILVDSPLACQYAANFIIQPKNEVRNEVENKVRNEVENEVRNKVENKVENEVENKVWNEVENEVENEVGNKVGNKVENEVENKVRNEVENKVENEVRIEVGNKVENEVRKEVRNEVRNKVENKVRNEVRNKVGSEVRIEVGNKVENEVRKEVRKEVWKEVRNEVWIEVENKVRNEVENKVENEVRIEVGNKVENKVRNEVGNEVWNEVRNKVRNEVGNEVGNKVRNEVRNKVRNEVGNEVGNEVWNEVWNEVRNKVRIEVGNEVGNKVRNEVGNEVRNNFKYYSFSNYINYSDFGWLSYYDYIYNELGLRYDSKLQDVIHWVEHSFMSIQFQNYCIVSKYPSFISRNANKELHNLNDVAIKFADGYGQYYFNGINIPTEMFNLLKEGKYTFEQWVNEKNEETKAMVLAFYEEKFGGPFVCDFLGKSLTIIDTFINKKEDNFMENTTRGINLNVYSLFKGNISNFDIAYVRCYCPSTDRMFFLGVNPEHTTAKDAIASLCQVPTQLLSNLKSIKRQGEIFSFNFDEKGTQQLKDNTIDFSQLTSLSGELYFKKLQYEY